MKINITKKEYRLLLDVFSIATWVMNSHKYEPDPKSEPYETLEQKFLAFAKEFGFKNLVEYDKKMGKYYHTAEYEESESDMQFIDEFEDDSFWEKLGSNLAKRDLINEIGLDEFKKMESLERFRKIDEIAEKYYDEFDKNGIKNIVVSKK
tara:strand:- start:525 stop:974 length:450 start_codon:yes stop_codon:yes gene_type:complete